MLGAYHLEKEEAREREYLGELFCVLCLEHFLNPSSILVERT